MLILQHIKSISKLCIVSYSQGPEQGPSVEQLQQMDIAGLMQAITEDERLSSEDVDAMYLLQAQYNQECAEVYNNCSTNLEALRNDFEGALSRSLATGMDVGSPEQQQLLFQAMNILGTDFATQDAIMTLLREEGGEQAHIRQQGPNRFEVGLPGRDDGELERVIVEGATVRRNQGTLRPRNGHGGITEVGEARETGAPITSVRPQARPEAAPEEQDTTQELPQEFSNDIYEYLVGEYNYTITAEQFTDIPPVSQPFRVANQGEKLYSFVSFNTTTGQMIVSPLDGGPNIFTSINDTFAIGPDGEEVLIQAYYTSTINTIQADQPQNPTTPEIKQEQPHQGGGFMAAMAATPGETRTESKTETESLSIKHNVSLNRGADRSWFEGINIESPSARDIIAILETHPGGSLQNLSPRNAARYVYALQAGASMIIEEGNPLRVIDAMGGPNTRATVVKLQQVLEIDSDGVPGPGTRAAIIARLRTDTQDG